MFPAQPATVPVPVPVPVPSQPAPVQEVAPSSTSIEMDITSKMLEDPELRSLVDMKVSVSGGAATLSGTVPTEDLKRRAERVAKSVKGVRMVINNLTVQP